MTWSPLFHKLLGQQWVESQVAVARRWDDEIERRVVAPGSGEGREPELRPGEGRQ